MKQSRQQRAHRFDRFMDHVDGDWQIPARIEQAIRWLYVRLP